MYKAYGVRAHLKTKRGKADRQEMHLLVMIAERVWDTQFGNIHQSRLSIPGVGNKEKCRKKESVPKSPHHTRKNVVVRCAPS